MGDPLDARQRDGSEIAVTGLSCRFPGARNVEEFWRNLCDGIDSISHFEPEELDRGLLDPGIESHPSYVRAAPVLDDADRFDAAFFDYSPKEAEVMDPQQRLFLEACWDALESAGYDPATYPEKIGVFAGASTDTYVFNLFTNRGAVGGGFDSFQVGLGNDLAFLANRVSYKLDLRGPSLSVHTACSTSLVAVHLARQSLLIDECQIALAGAVTVRVPQKTGYLYQPGSVQSPDGVCRPFDKEAKGTLFGSGVGVVVLKRLEEALEDRDPVLAVLRGSAVNNDGSRKASFTAPSVHGQADVLLEALAEARLDPAHLGYLEAHGTGTQLGDPIEIRALTRAFRRTTEKRSFCALGSVKSNLGHLDAAAGMPGLIKSVLAVRDGVLPPSLHFETPNPQLELAESPFFVCDSLRHWEGHELRYAGVSSFGVGGTNAHVILEQPPPPPVSTPSLPWQLLVLSAKTEGALDLRASRLADHLEAHPELELADVAYTLQVGRKAFDRRRTLVVRDGEDAVRQLREPDPQQVSSDVVELGDRGVVFLFPGGGSQHVGMGQGLYETEPEFRRHLDECADRVQELLGVDLRSLLYPEVDRREESVQRLRQTWLALPALFAVEYALGQLWLSSGVRPRALIGHSLGEYVAACLAGVFSVEDALALVVTRGRLLRSLPPGAMLSVSLPEGEVAPLLGEGLSLAAVNGASRCVVSGEPRAVEELAEVLAARGADHRRLPIDAAGHSSLVEPILDEFARAVEAIRLQPPTVPCISNLSGTWLTPEEAVDPRYWARHLRETVRFGAGLGEVLTDPNLVLLEVGPGRSLTVLARSEAGETRGADVVASMRHPDDRRPDRVLLAAAVGGLWLRGVGLDWPLLHRGSMRRRVALPTYPFEGKSYWIQPGSLDAAMAGPSLQTGKAPDVADWFYMPTWEPVSSPGSGNGNLDDVAGERWLLFRGRDGLGVAVERRLRELGAEVVAVVPGGDFGDRGEGGFLLDPEAPDGYGRLIASLAADGRLPTRSLHLWSLEPYGGDSDEAAFRRAQWWGYHSLVGLARAWVERVAEHFLDLGVVTHGVHDVSGDEHVRPESATVLGAVKVVSQEQEAIRVRAFDLRPPRQDGREEARLVDSLIGDLRSDASARIVAYRGARRWLQRFRPVRLTADAPPVRPLCEGGVYLLTGGLGGVGLMVGEFLARTCRARLALVGRSGLPPRAEWERCVAEAGESAEGGGLAATLSTLLSWEAAGAEVLVLRADVGDEVSMREAVRSTEERFGALHGVLHAAGVTSGASLYRPFTELGVAEAEIQFRPKAYGLYVLERVLGERPLDFCILFGSNAAVLGGLGYLAYSAVSSFMDAFAAARNRSSAFPWISADWDGWPEETKKYAGIQTSMDQYAMTRDESVEAFRRVATLAPEGQVSVPTGDFEVRWRTWVDRPKETGDEGGAGHERPDSAGSYVAPEGETEEAVARIWCDVLGLDRVGARDNFFDLGGHSLLATRLISRVNETLAVAFPLAEFFAAPTVRALSIRIEDLRSSADEREAEELLAHLAGMSEDEAEAELTRRGHPVAEQRTTDPR